MLAQITAIDNKKISLNRGEKSLNVHSKKFDGFQVGDIVSLYGTWNTTETGAWVFRVAYAHKASEKQIAAFTNRNNPTATKVEATAEPAAAPVVSVEPEAAAEPAEVHSEADIKAQAKALKAAGVKASEAAKQLGVSTSTFYRWTK